MKSTSKQKGWIHSIALRNLLFIGLTIAESNSAFALNPTEIASARADGTLLEIHMANSPSTKKILADILIDKSYKSFDVYFDSSAGKFYRAYSFILSKNSGAVQSGTPILVTVRYLGDSGEAVRGLAVGDETQTHMLVDENCQRNPGGNSPILTSSNSGRAGFICNSMIKSKTHAAFTTMEPPIYASIINGGTGFDTSNISIEGRVQEFFGVAVNKKLYLALQKSQNLVPTDVTAIDESPTKQPSIPKTFVSGALSGQLLGSSPTKKGWNLVIPLTVDSNVSNKAINVCRSKPGTGIQAASNAYFLNNPCGSTSNAFNATQGSTATAPTVIGSVKTMLMTGADDVEDCLTLVDNLGDSTGGGYGFGILSLSSDPSSSETGDPIDRGYRFVKISQATPTRNAVVSGDYDFVFDAWLVTTFDVRNTNLPVYDLLRVIDEGMKSVGITSGQRGYLADPSTVTGSWIDADYHQFVSHTSRSPYDSCSPLRMLK